MEAETGIIGGSYLERQRVVRVGLLAVLMALLFRLAFLELPQRMLESQTENTEKTGRTVRFSPFAERFFPNFVETPVPSAPQATEPPIPSFFDGETAQLFNAAKVYPDTAALLKQPLTWDLKSGEPAVLILHTHATESYTKNGEAYIESASWRTLDEGYNMLSIGDRVAALLEEAGICVIHDRTLHDRPSYDGAYTAARRTLQKQLEENPTIALVLDIHRDAAERSYGQLRTKAMVEGVRCAQLMMVVGTNHDHYEENLSIALKLHAQLERQAAGITRPLQLRTARYNQDLSAGAVIVEVGAAGNTHPEALRAADQLAQAVIALARGTN